MLLLFSPTLVWLFARTVRRATRVNGRIVFERNCAGCHRPDSGTRAPSPEALHRMSKPFILAALQNGKMKSQGDHLSGAEQLAVAVYLAPPDKSPRGSMAGACSPGLLPNLEGAVWAGWGVSADNSRFQPASSAGLNRDRVRRLKLRWAFGFDGAAATFGQVTVYGGRIFAGSENGTVYSLDAHTGCMYWSYRASATVKTAISVDNDGRFAYFGDTNGNVYSVSVPSGSLVWKVRPDSHPAARITGSPLLLGSRLFVPISSGEEGAAIDPKYPCCTFRGSVVALDANSGKRIWQGYTIPEQPHRTRLNALGMQMWGPSGAAVWSTPTADLRRRAIYVATGNNYSEPAGSTSDAVVAFDMASGRVLWSRQLNPKDLWNISCIADSKANCPDAPGNDLDFGAPPALHTLKDGRDIVIASQKSGVVYALDVQAHGKILWQTRIGTGGPLGGIEWGAALDRDYAYVPLSDWKDTNPEAGGGLFALNLKTGAKVWVSPPPKPDCTGQPGCSSAQMAPPTAIPGVVFAGSLDGHLRAYDTSNGLIIWDFNTVQDFSTINSVTARGGSLNGAGPAIADGMVYVQSGYTNDLAGNVLLAFGPDDE